MGRPNRDDRTGVPPGSPFVGYGAALAVVGVALVVQLALRPMLGHGASFLLFFAAVLVSAYLGGLGPGIAATALSAALSDYYLIPPLRTPFVVHLEESFGLLVFTLEGVLISALVAALHAARARAEAGRREIRLREQRFRSLVQNSSDIVAVLDRDGTVVYESPAVQRVLGFAPEERVGTGALELLHPEDRESLGRVLSDLLGRPGARVSAGYRVLDKAGRWRQFEAVGVNLLDDPAVEGVVVNSRDVTGRKEAEEGLRRTLRELAEFKFALDESAIVAFTDVGGRITYANDNFCEISGYSREELIGQDHRLINSGYHSKEYIRGLWRTIGRGKVWRGDFKNRAKDGSIYWVDTTVVPFLDERGKPYQYVAIRYEITARKKAEEDLTEIREAERKRIGRDLHDGPVQDVAHALAEMEVARALSEGRQDPRLDEAIEALRRAGGGLREAVHDLRRENGSRRQLVRAIESLVDLNRTIGGGREVTLTVEGGPCPDLPERQAGDVLRVVQEALTNARRHARAGHVAVTLRPLANGLRVGVADDGCGFDPETVAAGVGLKSMQERAKALGGELSVDSIPGIGTRVTLWAPLPTSDQPSSRPTPGSTPSGARY